ncbi:MAG TPA: DinB family protein [Candidatus Acidoferrum sp.]|nr:DinB family protein [Candidatus Acidoferrum sp.]
MKRPEAGEFAEYYGKYIAKVPGTDVTGILESERLQMSRLFGGRSERDGNFRYAPDKWTIKETLGHVTDAERIFTYRALRIGRGDETPLSSFEQDDYVKNGGFAGRTLADLAAEFDAVRGASISLFRSLDDAAWGRRGVASQKEVTVRALGFITAGHQIHHRMILEESYFPAIPRA